MFKDRKTSQLFYDIYTKLSVDERKRFSLAVKKLFDTKIISEEGKYHSFKIEADDLKQILVDLKI